jgi:hypothetical protein
VEESLRDGELKEVSLLSEDEEEGFEGDTTRERSHSWPKMNRGEASLVGSHTISLEPRMKRRVSREMVWEVDTEEGNWDAVRQCKVDDAEGGGGVIAGWRVKGSLTRGRG